jgi:beta-hydroxylase
MGQYRRRFKAWNKTAYNITRVALVVALAAFIYWI